MRKPLRCGQRPEVGGLIRILCFLHGIARRPWGIIRSQCKVVVRGVVVGAHHLVDFRSRVERNALVGITVECRIQRSPVVSSGPQNEVRAVHRTQNRPHESHGVCCRSSGFAIAPRTAARHIRSGNLRKLAAQATLPEGAAQRVRFLHRGRHAGAAVCGADRDCLEIAQVIGSPRTRLVRQAGQARRPCAMRCADRERLGSRRKRPRRHCDCRCETAPCGGRRDTGSRRNLREVIAAHALASRDIVAEGLHIVGESRCRERRRFSALRIEKPAIFSLGSRNLLVGGGIGPCRRDHDSRRPGGRRARQRAPVDVDGRADCIRPQLHSFVEGRVGSSRPVNMHLLIYAVAGSFAPYIAAMSRSRAARVANGIAVQISEHRLMNKVVNLGVGAPLCLIDVELHSDQVLKGRLRNGRQSGEIDLELGSNRRIRASRVRVHVWVNNRLEESSGTVVAQRYRK